MCTGLPSGPGIMTPSLRILPACGLRRTTPVEKSVSGISRTEAAEGFSYLGAFFFIASPSVRRRYTGQPSPVRLVGVDPLHGKRVVKHCDRLRKAHAIARVIEYCKLDTVETLLVFL